MTEHTEEFQELISLFPRNSIFSILFRADKTPIEIIPSCNVTFWDLSEEDQNTLYRDTKFDKNNLEAFFEIFPRLIPFYFEIKYPSPRNQEFLLFEGVSLFYGRDIFNAVCKELKLSPADIAFFPEMACLTFMSKSPQKRLLEMLFEYYTYYRKNILHFLTIVMSLEFQLRTGFERDTLEEQIDLIFSIIEMYYTTLLDVEKDVIAGIKKHMPLFSIN